MNVGVGLYVCVCTLVCVHVCVRGCALYREYGDSWHKGGMLGNKQNVFDDFVSAAEYLVQNKYTNPSRSVQS